jgi:2,3-bisphosphoglycerate-independent phosphoglycerate mutase
MDGAAGYPLLDREKKTCLELAKKPHLDSMAKEGTLGLVCNVPQGMEPSSAIACMSLMGYDPKQYYSGRGPIEAKSMGIELKAKEAAFRCNLVTVADEKMKSYSSDHISDKESHVLIKTLNEKLGNDRTRFYPGVSYRHLLVVKDGEELIKARCTPPHDIPDMPVMDYMPQGTGSRPLNELMYKSKEILKNHPVNRKRVEQGKLPATSIWLFWGGNGIEKLPPFAEVFKKSAAMTSGVDLLKGIAKMAGIENLDIKGVTGGLDNDYRAQMAYAVKALDKKDVVIIHVEAPDEAGHMGLVEEKIKAIEAIDREMVKQLADYNKGALRILVLPDHPTPITVQTHTADPVPFLIYGPGIDNNSAKAFTEKEAESTGFIVSEGHSLMGKLLF